VNDQEELDFRGSVEIEGEEACSGSLIITKELKHCQLFEFKAAFFNFDSTVVLPEALSEIACCYLFAMENPSKLLLITGHADKSGKPLYNDWISLRRAESVLNILLGDRVKWVDSVTTEKGPILMPEGKVTPTYQPKGKSKVEDYQAILRWAAIKYGWPCEPGRIPLNETTKNWQIYAREAKNKKAIEIFQEKYEKDFRTSIKEDSGVKFNIGPNTWGAFFDLYMLELAELLGHSDTSSLETYRNALKFVDDNRKIVYGGETHARSAFSKSKRDRRVNILFFDPIEKPELKYYPYCHESDKDKFGRTTLGEIRIGKFGKKAKRCELYGIPGIYGHDFLHCDLDHILCIKVLDCEENPMSNVKVIIEHEVEENGVMKRKEYENGSTNANGVYIVRGVQKGVYFIRVDTTDRALPRPKGFEGVEERVEFLK